MTTEPATDGGAYTWRLAMATASWLVGAALTYGAAGMNWWSTPDYDPRFPDPVWGLDALHRATAPGAATVIVGGLLMVVCWWVSGRSGRTLSSISTRHVTLAVRGARVLRPLLAVLVLVGLVATTGGLVEAWARDWVAYPGWSRSVVAQALTLVALLLLPRPDDPRRWAEAGWGRLRIAAGVVLAGVSLAVPLLPGWLADVTAEVSGTTAGSVPGEVGTAQSGAAQSGGAPSTAAPSGGADEGGPGSSTEVTDSDTPPVLSVSESAAGSRYRWVQVSGPAAPGDSRWWHRWRGAGGIHVVPTGEGDSVAALVDASSPTHTALAVLDGASGRPLASWDTHDLDARGLGAAAAEPGGTRLFGAWLLHEGPATEWLGADGAATTSVPTPATLPGLRATQVDGLHARSTTSGAMWFVGDDAACQRRAMTEEDGSWVHDRHTVVALELCTDTTPARATLLGLDTQSGERTWSVPVPGFEAWAAGLSGPVPTLSSTPWPVTVVSTAGSGAAGAEGASGAAGDNGTPGSSGTAGDSGTPGSSGTTVRARTRDPGEDSFTLEVGGQRHTLATATGKVLAERH